MLFFPYLLSCSSPPIGLLNQLIEAMTSRCIVRPWKWPLIYGICCNGHVPRWMWAASVGRYDFSGIYRDESQSIYIFKYVLYIQMILIISESSILCWWINWETAGDSGAEMMMGCQGRWEFFTPKVWLVAIRSELRIRWPWYHRFWVLTVINMSLYWDEFWNLLENSDLGYKSIDIRLINHTR